MLKRIRVKRNLNNFDDKKRLIELLLECPSLQNAETRRSLLALLPPDITKMIKINILAKVYVLNIVNACMKYAGGFKHLFEAIRLFDEKTEPFQTLIDEFIVLANNELSPKPITPDILNKIEINLTKIMTRLHLSSQIKFCDEFTRHDHSSLSAIQEAIIQLKLVPMPTPEYTHLFFMVGSALSAMGELLQAERLFIRIVENTQTNSEKALAYFNLFQVQLRRKLYSKALANLQAAIAIEPQQYALHDTHKYPIERLLGVGGMGCVFLCQNCNPLIEEKLVVVKCFWETPKGPIHKVFNQIKALYEVANNYIPKPLDIGYADTLTLQKAFFVTEYINDAVNGEVWLNKYDTVNLKTGLQIALQIAKILQVAHDNGIFHLNIKPTNVLLKKFSEVSENSEVSVTVKMTDFGLSQIIPSLRQQAMKGQLRQMRLTRFGQAILGSLDYLSPEQRDMTQYNKHNAKIDVFGFGATMYRFFSGKNPRYFRKAELPDIEALRDLLFDCIQRDPITRLDSTQLVSQLTEIEEFEQRKQAEIARKKAEEEEKKRHAALAEQQLESKQGKLFEFQTPFVNAKGRILHRTDKKARCQTENLGNDVILEKVYIPGGTFLMGSPTTETGHWDGEAPQHTVTIKPFFISKYLVTQAQFVAVMGKNPSFFKGKERPVERVSWYDAVAFCERLSEKTGTTYRLPSEAEWEYACRAGITTPFCFGKTMTCELANYNARYIYAHEPKSCCCRETTEVGNYPPNAFGIYDMHGNVWEWCADIWHDNYEGAPTDGSVWETRISGKKDKKDKLVSTNLPIKNTQESIRVLRGGSWVNNPIFCRAAYRVKVTSRFRNEGVGIRVVAIWDF